MSNKKLWRIWKVENSFRVNGKDYVKPAVLKVT
jgi:hypothetical protein